MELTPDERLLVEYLNQWCPSPDVTGAIALGVQWAAVDRAAQAHTDALKAHLGGDWGRLTASAHALRDKGLVGVKEAKSVWKIWPTMAGRTLTRPAAIQAGENPPHSPWERKVGFGMVSLWLLLLAYLAIRNEPFRDANITAMVRMVLSVMLGIVGSTIPGFILIEWKGARWGARAGGAFALFMVCYLVTPKVLPAVQPPPPSEIKTGDAVDVGSRTMAVGRDVPLWLDNVPENSKVTWSGSSQGFLDGAEGTSVRYTATKPGKEEIDAEVRTPTGEVFHRQLSLRTVPSLENLPGAKLDDPVAQRPQSFPSQLLAQGAIRNPLTSPIRIQSVTFRADRLAADLALVPAVEMFPFLDYLVVKPVDRGWGEPQAGEIKLLVAPPRPEAEADFPLPPAADLLKVFDIRTPTVKLDAATWGRHQFLPLGAAAEPFSVLPSRAFSPDAESTAADWRPRALLPEPVVETVKVAAFVSRTLQDGPAPGSVTRATGELRTGGKSATFAYRTRTLQPAPAEPQGSWLAQLVGAEPSGHIDDGFVVATGDLTSVPLAESVVKAVPYFAAEIHLRDGSHREFSIPVSREVDGGREFKFDLLVNTSKSLSVTGSVYLDYRVGDGPVLQHEAARVEGGTFAPRPDAAGWGVTEQFLKELRTQQPGVSSRAVEILERVTGPRQGPATRAARLQLARQWRDAILVLMTEADAAARRPQVLARLKDGLGRLGRPNDHTGRVMDTLFPVVCVYFPEVAVPMAVAQMNASPGMIAQCVTTPEAVARLAEHKEAIGRAIADGALSYPPALRTAVALLSDLPESVWRESPEVPWREEWAVAAWSLSKKPNARLEAAVRKRLSDPALGPPVSPFIIGGLTAGGNGRFREEVAAVVERASKTAAESFADYQSLVAGLRYLVRFRGGPGIKPLMSQLEDYPYDAQVRDLAKQILGTP